MADSLNGTKPDIAAFDQILNRVSPNNETWKMLSFSEYIEICGDYEILTSEYYAPSTPSGGSSCFPASALVSLDTGATVRMDSLVTGMRVLAISSWGTPLFSEVFTWTHHEPGALGTFVRLTTDVGAALTLTGGHYVYTNLAGCPPGSSWARDARLLAAADVRLGHGLWVTSSSAAVCSPVVQVHLVMEPGYFSPVSSAGTLVVDSVAASVASTSEALTDRLCFGCKFPALRWGVPPPDLVLMRSLALLHALGGRRAMALARPLVAAIWYLSGERLPPMDCDVSNRGSTEPIVGVCRWLQHAAGSPALLLQPFPC